MTMLEIPERFYRGEPLKGEKRKESRGVLVMTRAGGGFIFRNSIRALKYPAINRLCYGEDVLRARGK